MSGYDYDLFVIGGGSGGVRAARIASGHGARVGLAEEYRFGGTCVIRGCVPKKLLVYASRFADEFEAAASFGWSLDTPRFDWPTLIANKDREITRLEGLYGNTLENAGVELHRSRAVLRDAHTIELVAEQRTVTADRILIATGGKPNVDPDLPGVEHVITSNELFDLPQLPQRVAIAGGGYIACEFACLLNGLGVETTLIYRGEEILRGFDGEVRRHVREAMEARGVKVVLGQVFTRVDRTPDGLEGELGDGRVLAADQILFAIGRSPNVSGLGLERLGIEMGWNGHVVVDEYSRSSVPNIFAVGDVTDRVNLTPVAIREGHAFADCEFGGKDVRVSHDWVATGVFTTPEIGTVGLSEEMARERHRVVEVYRSSFRPMKATLGRSTERMLIKLLVDGESDCVVGAHVVGPDAAEFAQLLAVPMRLGITKAELDATMAVHPTAAEEFVTMSRPAARHVRGE